MSRFIFLYFVALLNLGLGFVAAVILGRGPSELRLAISSWMPVEAIHPDDTVVAPDVVAPNEEQADAPAAPAAEESGAADQEATGEEESEATATE